MEKRINYGYVRTTAELALEAIAPQVPTINQPGTDDREIVPPEELQGFRKLVFSADWIELQHQTPPGVKPHIGTRVKRHGPKLTVTESVKGGDVTEVVFVDGKLEGAATWNPLTRVRVESGKRENLRRIKKTLRA